MVRQMGHPRACCSNWATDNVQNGQSYATRGVSYCRVSRIFMSRIFHPCNMVPHFQVPQFHVWHFQRPRSNAPHRLLSTQPPCCARQPNDVISVLAGPLKCRLAGLICILHPTGCTTGCTVQIPCQNLLHGSPLCRAHTEVRRLWQMPTRLCDAAWCEKNNKTLEKTA